MRRVASLSCLLIAASFVTGPGIAQASPTRAFESTNYYRAASNGYYYNGAWNNYTLGFTFTASQAMWITELGMFDMNADGPGTDRQVGIFEIVGSTYTLLGSTHFGATQAPTHRIDGYDYHDVTDFKLLSGHLYALVASGYYGGDQNPGLWRSETTLHGINFGSGVYNATHVTTDGFATPLYTYNLPNNGSESYYTYMGANFLWDTQPTSVPEPGMLALSGLGLALAGALRRRSPRKG